jgi:transcriptional regulator with XRE-family HTH domain
MTFGERLKKARKDSGMTQIELAAKVGSYQTKYQNWEGDVHEPDIATIKRLSDALGVSIDWLMGRDESAKPYPKEFEKEMFLLREEMKQYGPASVKRLRKMLPLIFEQPQKKKERP